MPLDLLALLLVWAALTVGSLCAETAAVFAETQKYVGAYLTVAVPLSLCIDRSHNDVLWSDLGAVRRVSNGMYHGSVGVV